MRFVQNRVPLHADLPLDARNAVIVLPHRRGEGSLARNGGRGHHERTVDVAPVILCGDTEILERLPAQADLDLRHVALALVVVLNIADVGVNGVFGIVFVIILGPVTHRTVRREAETESQPLRHRHLESDVVKVERVVGRPFPDASDRLGVVVVLPLQPEVEKESLLRSRAVSRGVEQVDRTHRTHGHTRTAHRAHLQRTGGILFADAVHRIGRECVNTACLGRNGKRKHRCSRDNQLNQGVLHLHCTLKFDPIRKKTRLQFANIVFLILFAKYFASPPVKLRINRRFFLHPGHIALNFEGQRVHHPQADGLFGGESLQLPAFGPTESGRQAV